MEKKFSIKAFLQPVIFPFYYLEYIKRPGKNYFLKKIILEDFILVILGTSLLSKYPIIHALGIFFLLLSFWCIYEIGYYENDLVAEKFEQKPVLSNAYEKYHNDFHMWTNWLWALMFMLIGVIVIEITQLELLISTFNVSYLLNLHTIGLWLGLLVVVRMIFYVYNHIDKKTRIWFYLLLQTCKYLSFSAITSINIVSVMLFISQIFAAFISYFTYRFCDKGSWPESIPQHFIRLMFFILLTLFATLDNDKIWQLANLQLILIFLFCVFKARHEIKLIWQQCKPIYQDKI